MRSCLHDGFLAGAILLGLAPHGLASGSDGVSSAPHAEDNGSLDEKSEEMDGVDKSWTTLPRHRDEDQVRLDVDRSFIYYPNGTLICDLAPAARIA